MSVRRLVLGDANHGDMNQLVRRCFCIGMANNKCNSDTLIYLIIAWLPLSRFMNPKSQADIAMAIKSEYVATGT